MALGNRFAAVVIIVIIIVIAIVSYLIFTHKPANVANSTSANYFNLNVSSTINTTSTSISTTILTTYTTTAPPAPKYPANTLVFSYDTSLSSNVSAINILIEPGVNITTYGYEFIALNNFTDYGNINTTTHQAYMNLSRSYGGAGGGGGGAKYSNLSLYKNYSNLADPVFGSRGQNTTALGGRTGSSGPNSTNGFYGSSAGFLQINNYLISSWSSGGISNFLSGGSGGNGANSDSNGGGSGGAGGLGVYIQASNISIFGNIDTSGGRGGNGACSYGYDGGGGGGGGGGSILLAYKNSIKLNRYLNTSGGAGGLGDVVCDNLTTNSSSNGGSGGAGEILKYKYSSAPIAYNAS